MNDENLVKIQHFFEVDSKIKKEMYKIVPPSNNGYLDEVSIQKYTDSLYDSLLYIFSEFKCIAIDYFDINSVVFKKVIESENFIKNKFYNCVFDIDKLRLFYKTYISNMDLKFIDAVKDNCVGYTSLNLNKENIIGMAVSVNEILHFLHSYILNNDKILRSIPLIAEKKNEKGYAISLRGISYDLFNNLFESFPTDLKVGWTEMVATNERKLIMMVRDRGHALTIEISLNNNIARLEYFIPKLCNIDMINNLPGINAVNENSIGATGVIEVPINNLQEVLFDFISKVPTDLDMEIKKM